MNNILNRNIRAIHILAEQLHSLIRNHTHSYDITFLSVIRQVHQDGTCSISDQNGTDRILPCVLPGIQPMPGDYVWVKIPGGSLEDMHICGLKPKSVRTAQETTQTI